MTWVLSLVKILGSLNPASSVLVQVLGEIEGKRTAEAIERLSDPISSLHKDVKALSKKIYSALKEQNNINFQLPEAFYIKYKSALSILESNGHIELDHAAGVQTPSALRLSDPTYILYVFALYGDQNSMAQLTIACENCKDGSALNSIALSEELNIPVIAVNAVFEIFSANNLGCMTDDVTSDGEQCYIGN